MRQFQKKQLLDVITSLHMLHQTMKEKLERYPKVSKDFLKFLWGGHTPESDYDMPTGHHHMGQVFPG